MIFFGRTIRKVAGRSTHPNVLFK